MDDYRSPGQTNREQALIKLNVLREKVWRGLQDREGVEFERLGKIARGYESGAAIVELVQARDLWEPIMQTLFTDGVKDFTTMWTSAGKDVLKKACGGRFLKLSMDIIEAEKYIEDLLLSVVEGAFEDLLTRTAKEDPDVREFYQGEIVEDLTDYIIVTDARPIGEGGFSNVWSTACARPDAAPRQVAVKVLRMFQSTLDDPNQLKRIRRKHRREVKVWSSLHHKNVLPLLGLTHRFNECPLPSMVSPLMSGGNLHEYLVNEAQVLSLGDRFNILTEVLDGLSYLHTESVVHGDLSSFNVLMNDKKVYLTDFGLSKIISEFVDNSYMTSNNVAFNAAWAAPELMRPTYDMEHGERRIESSKACDIYSYGGIMLEVITGEVPYKGLDATTIILHKTMSVPSARPLQSPFLTNDIWSFIKDCWRDVPEDRPEAPQVSRKLRQVPQSYSTEALQRTLGDANDDSVVAARHK